MIKVERILRQSLRILWNYKVLWIFGLLLALTAGGAGSNPNISFNPGDGARGRPETGELPAWLREFNQWAEENLEPLLQNPEQHIPTFIRIGVALLVFILIVSLIAALIRYPAETAVIRMVDGYEQTGTRLGFRAGWGLGWSRRAFRIWVVDLIIALPVLVFLLVILVVGLVIYFSVTSGSQALAVVASLGAVAVFLLVLLVFILGMVFLGLLRNFFIRAAALENLGVRDSLRSGWALFRNQWKNAGLMWLVMVGIGLAFGLVSFVLFFLLIPAYLLLLIPAAAIALLPGLLAFGITSLFASGPPAWIIGIVAAMPFFFVVLFSPLLLLSGWYRVYASGVWTLTYREIQALSAVQTLDAAGA